MESPREEQDRLLARNEVRQGVRDLKSDLRAAINDWGARFGGLETLMHTQHAENRARMDKIFESHLEMKGELSRHIGSDDQVHIDFRGDIGQLQRIAEAHTTQIGDLKTGQESVYRIMRGLMWLTITVVTLVLGGVVQAYFQIHWPWG